MTTRDGSIGTGLFDNFPMAVHVIGCRRPCTRLSLTGKVLGIEGVVFIDRSDR